MKYLNDQYRVNMKDFYVRFRKKFEVKIFLPTCSDCEWNEICYINNQINKRESPNTSRFE